MLARLMFALVAFRARKGLTERAAEATASSPADSAKKRAQRTGVRGETYAYWYLRRHGYVLVARNFTSPGIKGEIDGRIRRPDARFRRGKNAHGRRPRATVAIVGSARAAPARRSRRPGK